MFEAVHRILFRICGSLFRKRIDLDFDEEVRAHLAELAAENERRGMSADEAQRAALLRFGGTTQVKENYRERRGIPYLSACGQDIRYAARVLRKSPGFTAIAVLTLAIGIGLNTTVFTVYDSVALRLLPVKHPGRVVRLMRWYEDGSRQDKFMLREFEYVRDSSQSFSGVSAAGATTAVSAQSQIGDGGDVIQAQLVSGNYFEMLGVSASIGRTFSPGEDRDPGANPVAVLSHRFWSRHYFSDPAVLGKTVLINGSAFALIGVAPQSFAGTGAPPLVPDVWIPLAMRAQIAPNQDVRVQVLARRKDGVDARQVAGEMSLIERSLETAHLTEARNVIRLTANPATFFDKTDGGFEVFVWVIEALLLAASSVLLIGCLNLVNLLLARGMNRQREVAVRRSLGAGRGRIVQQLCTETALIGLVGGATGFLFSIFLCRLLASILESQLMQYATGAEYLFVDLTPSKRVFLFSLGISLVVGLVVGLVPAHQAARAEIAHAIKQERAEMLGGRGRLRDCLIAAQIAVCLTLLVGAGLLGRGVQQASHADPGFETRHLFTITLPQQTLGNTLPEQRAHLLQIVRRLQETPQIQSAALTTFPPLMGHGRGAFQPLGSQVIIGSPQSYSLFNQVSRGYFDAIGIPLLRGRLFSGQEAEHDASVVIISERTAASFWPGEDPLGKQISIPNGLRPQELAGRTFTVIGVVKSVRSTVLSRLDPAYIYFPEPSSYLPMLLVRTAVPTAIAAPAIRQALSSIDGQLAMQMSLLNVETGPVRLQRLMTEAPAIVAALLGGLGLFLATVGVYGVVAYLVSQRTREIGVRMALGATRGEVLRLVFKQALKPVAWGVSIGLAGSAALSILLSKMVAMPESPDLLFGINPWNPYTFAAVTLVVIFVVLLASWAPARRATGIDPATSLRYE